MGWIVILNEVKDPSQNDTLPTVGVLLTANIGSFYGTA
jgi:hypothetical protein